MDLSKSLPFVVFILIGVVAGRRYALDKSSFSKLLLYFVSPIVFFETTWGSQIGFADLGLPVLIWLLASALAIVAYRVSARFMGSPDSNLLGFAMGSSNSGYFGLPVAAALYGSEFLPQMVLVVMGFSLFEYTTGFYVTARSHFSVKSSFKKLFALPAIYAFLLGLLLNEAGILRSELMNPLSTYLRGAYSFLGLMVLGLGLADISWKTFDPKFLLQAFGSRFIAWPVAVALIVALLRLDPSGAAFRALALVAFLPMAANGVVIATELKASPHKIAGAIALSTAASLVALNANVHLAFIRFVAELAG
ncbi:MAG TPA: AEC family transporter [Bdellovibrionota bacterium]|jgi:predicted permease|nr:AEC family transporter [Bdellovibrionota bacterium]